MRRSLLLISLLLACGLAVAPTTDSVARRDPASNAFAFSRSPLHGQVAARLAETWHRDAPDAVADSMTLPRSLPRRGLILEPTAWKVPMVAVAAVWPAALERAAPRVARRRNADGVRSPS